MLCERNPLVTGGVASQKAIKAERVATQIARFTGPTLGPPAHCRPQMGPMLVPWTLLSGHAMTSLWGSLLFSRHSELLSYGGLYASMWMEQLHNSQQQPAKCRSLPSFSKANKTSTPTSLRHATGTLSMTDSVISEKSRDSDGTHPFDPGNEPITDIIMADAYSTYQEDTSPDGCHWRTNWKPQFYRRKNQCGREGCPNHW